MKVEAAGHLKAMLAYAFGIKLYQALQKGNDGAGWIMGKQYLRAATCRWRPHRRSQSAESRADFIHKYGIAQEEARESLYWLGLLAESGIVPRGRLKPITEEPKSLSPIVTAIILKVKTKEYPDLYLRFTLHP